MIAVFSIMIVSESLAGLGPVQDIAIAVLILLVMIFCPGGLWAFPQEIPEFLDTPRSQIMARWKRRFRRAERQAKIGVPKLVMETSHGISDNGDPRKTCNVPAYAEIAEEVLAQPDVRDVVFLGGQCP